MQRAARSGRPNRNGRQSRRCRGDAQGNIWNAQWGAARLACYSPQGVLLQILEIGAAHATCPAFAGASGQIFCTSATEGIAPAVLTGHDGQTFVAEVSAIGQLEHQVIL